MFRSRPAHWLRGLATGVVLFLSSGVAHAQDWLLLGGVAAGEGSETDTDSRLLSRNDGDPFTSTQLNLWAGARIHPRLDFVALGEFGTASDTAETEAELEEAFLRYSAPGAQAWTFLAGMIASPLGSFATRRLPQDNPLIGKPDTYGVGYPLGVWAEGRVKGFDFGFGFVDEPLYNPDYVPEPGSAWRPTIRGGYTPFIGLHFGAGYTRGPYLSEDVAPLLPAGAAWQDFEQEILLLSAEFSRGHLVLHSEVTFSSYEAPTAPEPLSGDAAYVEIKYTWTPRLFTALRAERNNYPYIQPESPGVWRAVTANLYDAEIGLGFRITPGLLLKGSYRQDYWTVEGPREAFFPDGHAVALQISYTFDIKSWFRRPV
jgi:hypothetical protein